MTPPPQIPPDEPSPGCAGHAASDATECPHTVGFEVELASEGVVGSETPILDTHTRPVA